MHYTAYLERTQEAAAYMGGQYVSLAGGFYGVCVKLIDACILMALDLDDSTGWAAWREDEDGENETDPVLIGWLKLDKLLALSLAATE